jgi:hypothetical protein
MNNPTRYLEIMQNKLQDNTSLNKLFSDEKLVASIEALRQHYCRVYGENYFSEKLVPSIKVIPAPFKFEYEKETLSSAQFSLGLQDSKGKNGPNLVQFELTQYPYCCGMRQMNGFSYTEMKTIDEKLMENLVHQFTSACVSAYLFTLRIQAPRVMINFVEYRDPKGMISSDDIPSVENPKMAYPYFFTWAQKQKKFREMLMFNSNSGNIIHHAEVVLG